MIDRSEELVTVFGGDGFVGRYVCEQLFKSGVRVRVASRNPRNSYFIQPLAQVGQFGFVKADLVDRDSVRRARAGACRKMESLHVEGARNVAEAADDGGLDALVHVSAIGADAASESTYGR